MPTLAGYSQFGGAHWETSAIRNVLAHQGVTAPHTRASLSEALLLGLAGISVLYFVFEYEGYPPSGYVGTRLASPNHEPVSAIFQRLSISADTHATNSPAKAVASLRAALAALLGPLMPALPAAQEAQRKRQPPALLRRPVVPLVDLLLERGASVKDQPLVAEQLVDQRGGLLVIGEQRQHVEAERGCVVLAAVPLALLARLVEHPLDIGWVVGHGSLRCAGRAAKSVPRCPLIRSKGGSKRPGSKEPAAAVSLRHSKVSAPLRSLSYRT